MHEEVRRLCIDYIVSKNVILRYKVVVSYLHGVLFFGMRDASQPFLYAD